jgi:hypothetical protein
MQKSAVGSNRDWKGSDSFYDTISVNQTFGPWNVSGSATTILELDGPNLGVTDKDWYSYSAALKFTQKWGYVSGDFNWTRDYSGLVAKFGWHDVDLMSVGAYIYYKLGKAIYLTGEGKYYFGNYKGHATAADTGRAGYDFCLQGEWIDGPYKFGGMFALTNGQDPNNATKNTKGGGFGAAFRPLYAAFGEYDGLLNGDGGLSLASGGGTIWSSSRGLQLYYGFADYKIMEKLWLHAALGFLRWDDNTVDKSIGTEFDLGANYTITKGLDLGLHFGYFIPGAWFDTNRPNKGNHIHVDAQLAMKF